MSRRTVHWIVSCLVLLSAHGTGWALQATQPQSSQPASNPSGLPEGPLQIFVTRVIGKVQYRTPDSDKWQFAKEGMELPEGTEFNTIPFSRLQFRILPDQVFAVDRVTRVKVIRANFRSGKLITEAGMEFGRVRYDIEGAGVEHDATIRSPNATLAVRGTQVSLYDQPPFVPQAISLTGRAQFRDARKAVAFGGKGRTTVVSAAAPSAAQLALAQAVEDPDLQRARTPSEAALIAQFISRGSIQFFDQTRGIEVIRGGVPPAPQSLARTLPGLSVFLSWTGNANLDLSVGVQSNNEFLYPVGGLNRYPNRDFIPFDHQGGPHGGVELASFPRITNSNVNELLFLGASHIWGKPTDMTFSAFLNGKPAMLFDLSQLQCVPTISATLGPGEAQAAELPLGQEALLMCLAGVGNLPLSASVGQGAPSSSSRSAQARSARVAASPRHAVPTPTAARCLTPRSGR